VSFRDGVPVSPPIMPGWDRYPVRECSAASTLPGRGRQRRQHHGIGERYGGVARSVDNLLFVKIGTGIGCGIYLHGEVYRGTDGCAGDIGHIQVDSHGRSAPAATSAAWRRSFGGAALARERRGGGPRRRPRRRWPSGCPPGLGDRPDVADGAAEGDVTCIGLIRDGGAGRRGARRPGQLRQPVDDRDRRRARRLGHILLAEIRSVVYRRSLPLATGNLPVVLSELGPRAGVVGAAVLASELRVRAALMTSRPTRPAG
jgi:predicted NBD/HSP70 family sugar kinase